MVELPVRVDSTDRCRDCRSVVSRGLHSWSWRAARGFLKISSIILKNSAIIIKNASRKLSKSSYDTKFCVAYGTLCCLFSAYIALSPLLPYYSGSTIRQFFFVILFLPTFIIMPILCLYRSVVDNTVSALMEQSHTHESYIEAWYFMGGSWLVFMVQFYAITRTPIGKCEQGTLLAFLLNNTVLLIFVVWRAVVRSVVKNRKDNESYPFIISEKDDFWHFWGSASIPATSASIPATSVQTVSTYKDRKTGFVIPIHNRSSFGKKESSCPTVHQFRAKN